MNVIAVADKIFVELGHKKRGGYVAGLSDIDNDMADTSFPERPLEAIDSFGSRMTETGLAGGQFGITRILTETTDVSVGIALLSKFRVNRQKLTKQIL